MVSQSVVSEILAAEFGGEFATEAQKAVRAAHVVSRRGTVRGTTNIQQLVNQCEHTPGVWHWSDGSATVVDIRLKNAAAAALGSATSPAKTAAARANGRKGGRPKKA